MSGDSENTDINDTFEKILFSEDLAEQTAYQEGFDFGKSQRLDGYHLGYHRGASLAAQLGFFFGVLQHIQTNSNVPKIIEQTKELSANILQFPVDNNDAVDLFDQFETIKLKFKKICSLAKIDSTYTQTDKLDF